MAVNPDNLNEIVEKLTAAEKKVALLKNGGYQPKTGIELSQQVIDLRHAEEEVEYLTKLKDAYWEGYPEDDGYEEAGPDYNFWDDRTY